MEPSVAHTELMRRWAKREAGEPHDAACRVTPDVGPAAPASDDLALCALRRLRERRRGGRPAFAEETQQRQRERPVVARGEGALQGASERLEPV